MTEHPADLPAKDPLQRLSAALEAYLEVASTHSAQDREHALARHAGVRDLLEPMLRDDAADEPGPGLSDFRVEAELGRGGMGIVYRAQQVSLHRTVALKVLLEARSWQPEAIMRFRREAETMARLDHPGIAKVHAVGADGSQHWLAMELVVGASLKAVLGRLKALGHAGLEADSLRRAVREELGISASPAQTSASAATRARGYFTAVAELGEQLAEALAHAHAQGVVHRDVKPANVLVREDGRAVLTDFGLARQADRPGITMTGDVAGTPYYMSPEQAEGRARDVDARSDVFSLGALLYELAALQRPFEGESTPKVLERIRTTDPVDPRRLVPALGEDLAAIVLKALEKDPAQRYQSAGALAEDLRAFREQRPVAARRPHLGQRLLRAARREPARAALVVALAIGVPAVTALLGYLLAKSAVIERGEVALRSDVLERALSEGFLWYTRHDAGLAEKAFTLALASDPESIAARAGLLLVEARRGSSAARKQLDTVRTGCTGSLRHFLDAEAALAEIPAGRRDRGRWRQALDRLQRAQRTSPVARAFLWSEIAAVAHDLGDAALVNQAAEVLHELWPGSIVARFWRGTSLLATAPAQAAAEFEQVLGLHRGNVSATINLGLAKAALGQAEAAEALMRQALAVEPQSAEASANLARLLRGRGAYAEALLAIDQALAVEPENGHNHGFRGQLLARQEDWNGALLAFERATEHAPDVPDGHYYLAIARENLGDLEGAEQALERFVTLAPDDARGPAELGVIACKRGDFDRARPLLERARDLGPERAAVHANLSYLLSEIGDPEGELAEAKRWKDLHPDDPMALQELAWLLVRPETPAALHDPVTALACIRRAIAGAGREDAGMLLTLAEAQYRNGEGPAAVASVNRALTLLEAVGGAADEVAQQRQVAAKALARYQLPASRPASRG